MLLLRCIKIETYLDRFDAAVERWLATVVYRVHGKHACTHARTCRHLLVILIAPAVRHLFELGFGHLEQKTSWMLPHSVALFTNLPVREHVRKFGIAVPSAAF